MHMDGLRPLSPEAAAHEQQCGREAMFEICNRVDALLAESAKMTRKQIERAIRSLDQQANALHDVLLGKRTVIPLREPNQDLFLAACGTVFEIQRAIRTMANWVAAMAKAESISVEHLKRATSVGLIRSSIDIATDPVEKQRRIDAHAYKDPVPVNRFPPVPLDDEEWRRRRRSSYTSNPS
jgi:hypothetical protein